MRERRIAIHTDGALVQGNERQLAVLMRGLLEKGHDVHVSARRGTPAWEHFAATGARISGVRVRGTADLLNATRFARWLQRIDADAILFTSWRRLWIAAAAARLAGVPNRVMRFGGRHTIPRGWRGAHYRHALLHLVDRVYVNSSLVRDHLLHSLPALDPARVRLVPNGIEAFQPPPSPVRARLGIPAAARVVAAVGGLVPLKGFDLLIRACAHLEEAHLVVCGEGVERTRLEALAHGLGMSHRTHLIGQTRDVPGVLAAADAFVLSSRTEGFSVALLEAMRAGLPVIAADVGGARDALCDDAGGERAGWIVPVDDVDALRTTLAHVLDHIDSAAVRTRAEEARRRVRDRFTVEQMVNGVERVLFGA